MKKSIVCSLCIINLFILTTLTIDANQHFIDENTGIRWSQDIYNNLCLNIESMNDTSLEVLLKTFIKNYQKDNVGNAFIVHLPHDQKYYSALINTGFSFYHANQDGTKWVIKNGSPMPVAVTTLAGACVIVHNEGKVLMVEEKHKPGRLFFPGGAADQEEFIIDAAQRELQEEVGIVVKPEDLRLLAFTDRVQANVYGYADCYHYFFIEYENVSGEIQLQASEIVQAKWISLDALASLNGEEALENFKVGAAPRLIAKHIISKGVQSIHTVFDDMRQYITGKKNPQDTMHLYLFKLD